MHLFTRSSSAAAPEIHKEAFPVRVDVTAEVLNAEEHVKRHENDVLAATTSASMQCANVEERLKALALRRRQLLNGMREQLPPDYDPLKFENQEERAIGYNVSNELDDGGMQAETMLSTLHEFPGALNHTKANVDLQSAGRFAPPVRPNRMLGVEEVVARGMESLRANAVAVKPTTVKARQTSPPKSFNAPAARSSPRRLEQTPLTAASTSTRAHASMPASRTSPRVSGGGATTAAAGLSRPLVSPARGRTAVAGTAVASLSASASAPGRSPRQFVAGNSGTPLRRQPSDSPSRGRAALYGQDVATRRAFK